MISDDTKKQILSADLYDVISGLVSLKKKGAAFEGACPMCNTGKLQVSKAKGIYKCWSCELKGNNPVTFVMETQKKNYPEALKYVADKCNIIIEEAPRLKGPQKKTKTHIETFCDRQLKMSGIDAEQQKATIPGEGKDTVIDLFEAGTRDQYGKLTTGDDMIIWYYDLEGKPIMFQKPKSTKTEQLFRVRWQNPDLHKDKAGRPMKYSSPYGSGSHLFIPPQLRQIYKDRRIIKRLFIQEGEKKALKACIHGLPSVGVMGIQNIASEGRLPYDLQLIIQACKVEEVIFVLDADWSDLSNDLKPGDRVDKRPYNFFYAVRNFREYFKTFRNLGIYLEIYFAYVQPTENNDKGLDDLLSNTLAGKEIELLKDVETCINEKTGTGDYIQMNKITTLSDLKLLEYWELQSAESFAKKYKETLINLPEFMIGKHKWRFGETGKLEPAQPLQEDEQYWDITEKEDRSGNIRREIRFRYLYAYNFLKRRGFGRLMMANRQYLLARIENKVVDVYESYQIRDFMTDFTKEIVEKHDMVDVMDMLYRGGKMYFGPDSLGNIDFVQPKFETSDKNYQMLFFRDKYWQITADGIEEHPLNELKYNVWKDKVNDFDSKLLGDDFVTVKRMDESFIKSLPNQDIDPKVFLGQYDVIASPAAEQCHFMKFLYNTGEFFWRDFINPSGWRPLPNDKRSVSEKMETNLHFVSKMTAIGYLLHKYRDKSCEKAIVAMDGRVGEIGDSNGRTGKSIFGFAIGKAIPQTYIGAKSKDLTDDPFIWEEVSEKTDNIFLDDVRANIDFEFFFPVITGKITINTKGTKKFTLSEQDTPKILLTTNHAINGESASFKDRQHLIAFSDYYNDNHKPIEDFGINFFDEWGQEQWNLFYNFIGRCLQLYFKAARLGWGLNGTGLIQGPIERLEMRRLRQFIGEAYLTWADEYYGTGDDVESDDIKGGNINIKIPRNELYNAFLDKNQNERKFVNPFKFKKKIMSYCLFRKLKFNPQRDQVEGKPGDDKAGGVEYFTIANAKYVNL